MSKAILISIKPKWCAKIMNGDKTIEVRKNKALASAIQKIINENGYADIYVYCSKDKKGYLTEYCGKETNEHLYWSFDLGKANGLNGKVLFKFRCYKVEEISWQIGLYELDQQPFSDFLDKCCLGFFELKNYLNKKNGYAIHINNLEIFDKPKELSEFKIKRKINECSGCKYLDTNTYEHCIKCEETKPLTKAPQNMIYIEVENND